MSARQGGERVAYPIRPDLSLAGTRYGHDGHPVLLLHGGGQTRHSWHETAMALMLAGYRAYAVDQRGHGESDRAPDAHYSFREFAADARALAGLILRETGTRPVAVGASLGGIAALLAAADGGMADFSGLVLVDITPRMDPEGVAAIQGFMRDRVQEGFASLEDAAEAVASYLPHRPRPRSLDGLRKNLRLEADGRYRWHWDPAFLDGPRPVASDHPAIQAEAFDCVRALAIPTLLVRGRSSELVREEYVEEFRALHPATEYADIAGARHMVAGDSNDAFSAAILDFLRRRIAA
jgi:pimeloyl-ACP methyl ester carboxylesterase